MDGQTAAKTKTGFGGPGHSTPESTYLPSFKVPTLDDSIFDFPSKVRSRVKSDRQDAFLSTSFQITDIPWKMRSAHLKMNGSIACHQTLQWPVSKQQALVTS